MHLDIADDVLLFDYMFLEAQNKKEENERLIEENEVLREEWSFKRRMKF